MNSKRHILVSGASSGIGLAIAQAALNADHKVTGVARYEKRKPIEQPNFNSAKIDLSKLSTLPDQLSLLSKSVTDINALICCAGRGRFGSLEEFSMQQICELIDLNLTSTLCLVRSLLPTMKRNGGGHIVLIGSEAGLSGGKRGAVYSASKSGLRGFSQALRQECSSAGIHVTLINPGMVRTPFFDELDFAPGDDPSNYIEPADVANAVLNVLDTRAGTVVDEINLSPLKKVIQFNPGKDS